LRSWAASALASASCFGFGFGQFSAEDAFAPSSQPGDFLDDLMRRALAKLRSIRQPSGEHVVGIQLAQFLDDFGSVRRLRLLPGV